MQPEAVAITLTDSGQRFGEWSDIEFMFGIDSYSALSLGGPFDHERAEVREAFQPLMFPMVSVTINEELVMTGRVKDVAPSVDASQSSIGVTIYSLPFDLTEVCVRPDVLPLESNAFDLLQIAQRIVTPTVGVGVVFDGMPGGKFARIRFEPDATPHSVLVDLALQRGYVLSDLPNGDLLFRSEAPTGAPVARLRGQPVGSVSVQFQPSNWYSSITGRASQKAGSEGSRYTQANPLYKASNQRAFAASVSDTESADVPEATRAMVGRMVASVVSYTVDGLPGWRDPKGNLWRPNTTVMLEAPGAMVYKETELLIRSVKLSQTAEVETASLELVLPGVFGGLIPTRLPWES
jgi:prophage tail gpP-like protein